MWTQNCDFSKKLIKAVATELAVRERLKAPYTAAIMAA
jgi:hypothetical protein